MAIKKLNTEVVAKAGLLPILANVTGADLEQPIPGVNKHAPENQKFVKNLVILRETNPLLYKKLMSWD